MKLSSFDKVGDCVNINMMRARSNDLEQILRKLATAGYGLAFVVIIDRNDCYAKVKQAAELKVGILTQCIKSNTVGRMNGQIIGNIMLKVNAK